MLFREHQLHGYNAWIGPQLGHISLEIHSLGDLDAIINLMRRMPYGSLLAMPLRGGAGQSWS